MAYKIHSILNKIVNNTKKKTYVNDKLDKIWNSIKNGTIINISGVELTRDELLSKDESGIYLLEHLFNNGVSVSLKDNAAKRDVEIAYIFLKNNQPLFEFSLDEDALFSIIDDKRFIEHLLEKNRMELPSFLLEIKDNVEIVDLLCTYHKENLLEMLNQKLINKLITKNIDGIYPIEKYIHNEKVIENIFKSINVNKENSLLIRDFIKLLVDNKMFNLLINFQENLLLLEIYPSKTLLEILIQNGYNPNILNVNNKETISILYKFQKLSLLKNIDENILLCSIKDLFKDETLEDKTFLEYLIDNNDKFEISYTSNINVIKILYQKKRPDLLVKTDTTLLMTPIENDYTYLDYILDSIKSDNFKYDISSLFVPSNIKDKVKFYLIFAKHDMIDYIENRDSNFLLHKYDGITLLEHLLNADSELTLNKILNDSTKANDKIAVILKYKGIKQDNIDLYISKEDYEFASRKIASNQNYYGLINEEAKMLLEQLKQIFISDGKSNKEIIDMLITCYRNALFVNYSITIEEIKRLIEIKKNFSDFHYQKHSYKCFFNDTNNVVYLTIPSTAELLFHETGHALHLYSVPPMLLVPFDYAEIVKRVRQNPKTLIAVENFVKEYKKITDNIEEKFRQKVDKIYDDFLNDKEYRKRIKKTLSNLIDDKKEKYKDLQIPEKQLNMIISEMYTEEEYINCQKRIFINENTESNMRTYYGGLLAICDIIDAIYEGKLSNGLLVNTQGKKIDSTSGHGIQYYHRNVEITFSEIIANFAAIVKLPDAEENLQILKNIVGEEMYNMINNFYCQDILKLNIEELDGIKSYGGKR